jgi:hypothetical protein
MSADLMNELLIEVSPLFQ